MSSSGSKRLRERRLAEHSTNEGTLAFLAESYQYSARELVAENRQTPGDVLLKLLEDREQGVRWAAQRNPSTPARGYFGMQVAEMKKEVLEIFCQKHESPETIRALAQSWRGSAGELYEAASLALVDTRHPAES